MEFIRCCSILILVLTVFALGCSADGEALFKKNCLGCHRFKGVGGSISPDLTEVTKRRSDDWIRQQLKDPSVNNPNSKMPDFSHLSDKQIQAIIDYLKS